MSHAPSSGRPGYLVKRVQQLFRQEADEALRPLGLSMSQYAVLRALADHPGVSSAELARQTFVTRQSLRDVLGGLRAMGAVEVAERATEGRARPVTLTRSGHAKLRAAQRTVDETEERMLTGLGERDQERLVGLLTACAKNLS